MKPIELMSSGANSYRMRFAHRGESLEYEFEVEDNSVKGSQGWEDSFNEEAATFVKKCILEFHQAKESLMQEEVIVRSMFDPDSSYEVHNKRMCPLRVGYVTTSGNTTNYRVYFDQEGKTADYLFEVIDDGCAGLGWEHNFWLDIDGETDVARPLFSSILDFYRLGKTLEKRGEEVV